MQSNRQMGTIDKYFCLTAFRQNNEKREKSKEKKEKLSAISKNKCSGYVRGCGCVYACAVERLKNDSEGRIREWRIRIKREKWERRKEMEGKHLGGTLSISGRKTFVQFYDIKGALLFDLVDAIGGKTNSRSWQKKLLSPTEIYHLHF